MFGFYDTLTDVFKTNQIPGMAMFSSYRSKNKEN